MHRLTFTARRGMTLVELTVVLVILSLLAVAVLPALNRNPNKSLLRDTAATVQGHIAQGMSKAIGNRTGYGVWFDADAGTSGSSTATTLTFCQGLTSKTWTTTLTVRSGTEMTLNPPVSPSGFPVGTLISFVGYPYQYALDASGAIASLRADAGQTIYNTSFPTTTGNSPSYECVLSIPPTRAFGQKTVLRGNACVDLNCSTIGVADLGGFTTASVVTPVAPFRITFDQTGRANSVLSGSTQATITQDMPIALLVGLRDQVGQPWNPSPTDDDPGSNLQRRDAYWVVFDPRSSTSFVVENYGSSASSGDARTDIRNAQRFVREALLNRKTGS